MKRWLGARSRTLAFAAATWLVGWWALPVLGLVWGAMNGGARWVGVRTGVAAAIAWGALLLWASAHGPVSAVAAKAGAVMGFPPTVLYVVTLLFAALSAGSAAGFAASVRGNRDAVRPAAG